MCGKIRYKSRSQAEGVRRSLKRYSLKAYRCPECSGKVWHLGHPIVNIKGSRLAVCRVYGVKDDCC